jgi:hypothetical protein
MRCEDKPIDQRQWTRRKVETEMRASAGYPSGPLIAACS